MDYEALATSNQQVFLSFFLDLVGIASVAGGLQVASHLDATATCFSLETSDAGRTHLALASRSSRDGVGWTSLDRRHTRKLHDHLYSREASLGYRELRCYAYSFVTETVTLRRSSSLSSSGRFWIRLTFSCFGFLHHTLGIIKVITNCGSVQKVELVITHYSVATGQRQ